MKLCKSLFLTVAFLYSTVFAAVISREPYLQEMTSHSVVIAWRTVDDSIGEVVYVLKDGSALGRTIKELKASKLHHVILQNLLPDTAYQYQIVSEGKTVEGSSFKTFPDSDSALFSFGVLGDSGTASSYQKAIAARLATVHPDLVIHTGDVIYGDKSDKGFDQKFFSIYKTLLSEVPFFLTLGNHDVEVQNGKPYLENYYLPQNSPGKGRYYSFDCGEAHFISLDSNESFDPGSTQYEWLKGDLERSRKPLKIVFFHHPLYSSGFHGSSMRWRHDLQPLFEKEQVSLVFNGHDHDYERSKPIHGITYVVTGGGGADLYPAFGSSWTADSVTTYNFVYGRVNGKKIHLEAIDQDGKILDQADLTVNK